MRVRVDIETYSSVDLRKYGVYSYVQSPDFLILMGGWSVDGGPVNMITDEGTHREMLDMFLGDPTVVLVAHNAQFERVCFSRLLGLPVGTYLPPEQWHDTQAVAGEQGYPQRLEDLARALGGEQKDTAGTRLINMFSKPNRKGTRTLPEEKPEEWQAFMDYCAQDVVTLADVDDTLGDFPTEMERQIYWADQHINDRGFRIDVDLARHGMEAAADNRMAQELQVMHLTGISNPGSQPQFLKWCQQEISPRIRNLQKDTIDRLLASPKLQPQHREVLELRRELALVASKKFSSALASVSPDHRLRGTLKFFGAHTGRWSGKGTQVQNLPSESFTMVDPVTGKKHHDQVAEDCAILDLKMGLGASSTDLKRMVRPMFLVDGCVVDYAAIEARVIAWEAGEQWALRAFEDDRDIYVETAERMSTPGHPLTRAQGKVAVLALGYNGGINSLRAMGAEGTDEDLQRLVNQWRRANPSIVELWGLLGNAVSDEGPAGPHLSLTRDASNTVQMHLPSGRAITYHDMRWERYRVRDPRTKRMVRKEGWRYADPKRPGQRIGTYGGRLAENATQAIARDLMAEALVRLQNEGYRVVGHVHDEIIVEGTRDVAAVKEIMCQVPRWAKGLPVDGAGFATVRYRKD